MVLGAALLPCGVMARDIDWSTVMERKRGRPEPRWVVIVEEIRSQNRATLEAVESSRVATEQRIDRFEEKTDSRLTMAEAAIRSTNENLAALRTQVQTLDTRVGTLDTKLGALDTKVGTLDTKLGALDRKLDQSDQENRARFAALEVALQRMDQESRSRDASLEIAIRDLKVGVQQNSVDIRDLAGKVDAISRLEERVSALERRGA